jgi:hypothetical protein
MPRNEFNKVKDLYNETYKSLRKETEKDGRSYMFMDWQN